MKSEKGFIFSELVVAIAIMAIIALGAGVTTIQTFKVSQQNDQSSTVVRQAQNAGYWISHDALMAMGILTGDNAGTPEVERFTMGWSDWESGDIHKVRYVWSALPDSSYKLERKFVVWDRDGRKIVDKTTLVATNIYSLDGWWEGYSWKMVVEAHSGEKSAIREYRVFPRLDYDI